MRRHSSTALLVVLSPLISFAITEADTLAKNGDDAQELKESEELAFLRKPFVTADKLVLGNSTLYELDKNSGRLLTKLPLNSPIASNPFVINGTTYIATQDAIVRAVRNGREIWKTTLPIDQYLPPIAPAFVSGEYLLIGSLDHLTCLQRSTGKVHWKLEKARDSKSLELFGGRIYFPDSTNRICAIDPATGKTIWRENGNFRDASQMLIKDGAIYAAHPLDGTFCKLDLATGKTLWKKTNGSYQLFGKPMISLPGGYVAINCADLNLVVFNCSTGASYKYGPADHPPSTDKRSSNSYSLINSWLLNNGVLYTGGNGGTGIGGYMSAFDPIIRKRKWLTAIKDQHKRVTSTPAADPLLYNHQLIFPIATGTIYALQTSSGKTLWTTDTKRESASGENIFLSKDKICVYDRFGVSGLSASSGRKLWDFTSKPTENCTNSVQDGNRLYVQTSKATVIALDMNTGGVIWRFAGNNMKSPETIAKVDEKNLPPPLTKEEWSNAKKTWFWSRQKLAQRFCERYRSELDGKKLRRATVLKLLGQPEVGSEGPDDSSKWSDDYHLSEKSGELEIQYDSDGVVSSYKISDQTISLWDLIAPSQPKATVELARKALGARTITQIEKLLGRPDFSALNISPNFPTPLRYSSYRWNLAKDGRTFLNVRTCGSFDEEFGKRRLDLFAIITLSSDCPVQK